MSLAGPSERVAVAIMDPARPFGPAPTPTPVQTEEADGLPHIHCCRDHRRTLCGIETNAVPYVPGGSNTCVVCLDFAGQLRCPLGGICGRSFR